MHQPYASVTEASNTSAVYDAIHGSADEKPSRALPELSRLILPSPPPLIPISKRRALFAATRRESTANGGQCAADEREASEMTAAHSLQDVTTAQPTTLNTATGYTTDVSLLSSEN